MACLLPFEVCVFNMSTQKTLLYETFFFFDCELTVLESFKKLKEDTDPNDLWPKKLVMVKTSAKLISQLMAVNDWRNVTQFEVLTLAQVLY